MKTQIRLLLFVSSLLTMAILPLHAQVIADGTTATLSNFTNTSANVTVGTNGSFTLLILSNNTLLTNSANGTVGLNATARSNEVQLLSPSARWFVGNLLMVGSNGSFNRLVLSNGATVRDHNGYLGLNASASNNTAVVTGPGSLWHNTNLFYLGFNGAGNQLVISNGGVLRNNGSALGASSTSSNNVAVVTGSGSVWTNASDLQIGFGGAGCQLVVSNGGVVQSRLGALSLQPSSSNTVVVVTGSGSTWSNAAELYIGNSGPGNQLIVSEGGTVWNGHGYVGANAGASNNLALITGAGSTWNNALDLDIGAFSSNNRMIVSNGATVFTATNGLIGPTENRNANSVIVTGPGASWQMGKDLFVGSNAAFNLLIVSNGGMVLNRVGEVGFGIGTASNNLALVTGPGSVWSNSVQFVIGRFGPGNQLQVSNGGRVESNLGILGANQPSSNCMALVSGAGSILNIWSGLYVGASSVGNRLVISNGATASDSEGYLGYPMSSSNNEAVVTGPASVWTNATSLAVGNAGPGNRLMVTNGGAVIAGQSVILGDFNTSSNNRVVVDGGTLRATNMAGTGLLDVRRGTNLLNAGLVEVDRLLVTNTQGVFEFNGGTLSAKSSDFSNGQIFRVGNGINPATLLLASNGFHSFGPNGLSIAANGTLAGSGTLGGGVTVQAGGLVSPGVSIGKLFLQSLMPATLQGAIHMEISRNGLVLTNDVIQKSALLTYGGALTVSNIGPTPLALGDSFQLFIAGGYAGAFSPVTLPPLSEGLAWTNKLTVDGSIEVIADLTRPLGVDVSHFQNESGIPQAAWDQMYADGKRFVFIKATEGLTGPHDPTMAINVQRASTAGLLVGVYHYAHPENRPTTNGAILEASNMVVYADSAIGPGRLRPVLDLEGTSATLSTAALTDWVIAFCNEIIARRGPSAAPIIYCSQSFANNEFDSRLADYDLWIRTVNSGANPAVDDPPGQGFADATGVFNNWSFWQYSATGSSGGISPLDLNVCHQEFKPLASFLITNAVAVPMLLSDITIGPDGSFQFSFTNTPGTLFTVLASTNAALPLVNWDVLSGVTEISPGQFQFTDPQATNNPQRYYRVRWP